MGHPWRLTARRILKKVNKISIGSSNSTSAFIPKELKAGSRIGICTPMFTAAKGRSEVFISGRMDTQCGTLIQQNIVLFFEGRGTLCYPEGQGSG